MDTLPLLSADEKSWVEKKVGRPVSNDEAQLLLHQARLSPGPYEQWLLDREGAA